jgi:signal transduction histidine kinase
VLAARRADVLAHWKTRVQGTFSPDAMPHFELVDHIPQFLDEIVAALRADAGAPPTIGVAPAEGVTASEHGAQRLRLGFSLDAVVREYGPLRDAILATAKEAGAELTFRELQIVFDAIVSGIAHAVSEYARQRDAELLRQANEHFAFIAHELRDPLSSATMALGLLKQEGLLPAENRAVGALERGLRRTSDLVDQTLQIARVASGIQLRREWTTLRELLADVELGASPDARSKSVELRTAIEGDESVSLDVRLIRSALGNLLRNAVKFTAAGSTVELRGRIAAGRAVIEVEDACGGLPPGRVEEAFAPFVRLDERPDGFGLGLAIAKQAMDAHGGSIRVQNMPGKGCVFVLDLPVMGRVGPGAPASSRGVG